MVTNNRVLSETWPLMDDYLNGRISRAEYLSGYIKFFTNNFKRDYPFIDDCLENQTGFITMIADEATEEICMEYENTGLLGMGAIESYAGNPFKGIEHQNYSPFHWAILARLIYNGLDSDLKRFIDESGPIMPYLGYFTLHAVALERAHVDSRKNKTLSPLLLRHDNDPRSSDFIGRFHFTSGKQNGPEPYPLGGALGELFKYAQQDFKIRCNTPVDLSIAADINYHLGLQTVKHVPADPREAIIAAMKGDENMQTIITKAVDGKIKDYNQDNRKHKSSERKRKKDYLNAETWWGWEVGQKSEDFNESSCFASQEMFVSINELIEEANGTENEEIITQRLQDDSLTFRDLEERVNKSRNAISYRLKKLKEQYFIERK